MAFRWAHLSGGYGFAGNVGRTIGLLQGAALSPPNEIFATTPVCLFCKGPVYIESGNRWIQICDSLYPLV